MKYCINDVNFIRLLLLCTELFKFEIQKYGQILCVHKPYFLMPGHIFAYEIRHVAGLHLIINIFLFIRMCVSLLPINKYSHEMKP